MFDEKTAILNSRRVFGHSSNGIPVTDGLARFILTNKAYRCITGYTSKELASTGCASITHPGNLIENKLVARRIEAGNIGNSVSKKRNIRRNGVWVRNCVSCGTARGRW